MNPQNIETIYKSILVVFFLTMIVSGPVAIMLMLRHQRKLQEKIKKASL